MRNNPVKYTDPTGHIPIPLLTGAIGAVAGAGLYIWNESSQPDGFRLSEDWADLTVASASGAVSGAMIVTPLGIGMAAAQVGDHAINMIAGEDFSAGEHLVGSIAGAASGYVSGPVANLGKTVLTRRVAQGAAGAVTGGAGQVVVDSVDGQATIDSFVSGAMWGALDPAYGSLVELGSKGLSPNQETVWNGAFSALWEFYKGGSQMIFGLNATMHQMQ